MAAEFKACSVDGCNGDATTKARGRGGMCQKHYRRLKERGSVADPKGDYGKCQRWIGEHVRYSGEECLIWPFYRKPDGYGDTAFRGGHMPAHRAMCILAHGDPPAAGLDTAHSCGRGQQGCVNPKHLRWDTRSGNFADKIEHGTDARGEKSPVAKLTTADVEMIREMGESYTQTAIAAKFGVDQSNISLILRGKSRRWG